jgi:hypothetical protein
MVLFNNDPRLIDVTSSRKAAEKQRDDIEWEFGLDDPRIAQLAKNIRHWKSLETKGEIVEPNF